MHKSTLAAKVGATLKRDEALNGRDRDSGAHQRRSLGFGRGNVLGSVAGFDQVHAYVQAGSLSGYRRPDGPKYGIRHDHLDAVALLSIVPVLFFAQRASKDLLSDLAGIRLVHRCPDCNHAC